MNLYLHFRLCPHCLVLGKCQVNMDVESRRISRTRSQLKVEGRERIGFVLSIYFSKYNSGIAEQIFVDFGVGGFY